MARVAAVERYAVVSCHVERPLDDAVWRAFEQLLRATARRVRRHAAACGRHTPRPARTTELWLERARRVAARSHRSGTTRTGAARRRRARTGERRRRRAWSREEAAWLRSHGLAPRFFCGGGWYLDVGGRRDARRRSGYVDCTATTFRQQYLADGRAAAAAARSRRRLRLPRGRTLLELPATHSLGMLARGVAPAACARPSALPRLGARATESELPRCKCSCACSAVRRRPLRIDAARRAGGRRPRSWPGRRLRSPSPRRSRRRMSARPSRTCSPRRRSRRSSRRLASIARARSRSTSPA